jgi:hypothetical protein
LDGGLPSSTFRNSFSSDIDELGFALYKEIAAAMLNCFSSHLLCLPSMHALLLPDSYSFASISYEFVPDSYLFAPNSYSFAPNSYLFVPNSYLCASNSIEFVLNSFELKKVELIFLQLKRVSFQLN